MFGLIRLGLGLCWQSSGWDLPSSAGSVGSIPGGGSKIPHASQPKLWGIKQKQNIKQKQYCNKFIKTLKMVHIKKILKKKICGPVLVKSQSHRPLNVFPLLLCRLPWLSWLGASKYVYVCVYMFVHKRVPAYMSKWGVVFSFTYPSLFSALFL